MSDNGSVNPRVGVLFVHGIGAQLPGDTLKGFGDPFYEWVDRWVRGTRGPTSNYGFSARTWSRPNVAGEPRHWVATLSLPDGPGTAATAQAVEVIAAECCWAADFEVPTFARVLRWAAHFIFRVGRLVRLHTSSLWARVQPDVRDVSAYADMPLPLGQRVPLPFAILVFALTALPLIGAYIISGAFLLALPLIVSILLLTLRFVVVATRPAHPMARRVPGAGVARRVAQVLTAYIGDAEVLVAGVGRTVMVDRVQSDLAWLSSRVDRVVVVAHSQGARLSYEALLKTPVRSVAALVTVGGAVELLDDPSRAERMSERFGRFRAKHPGGVWWNVWATLDPVPAGPLSAELLDGLIEREVVNRNSWVLDHVTYFANEAEVIAPMAEVVAGSVGATLNSGRADERVLREAAVHRQRRVQTLFACRWQIPLLLTLFGILWLVRGYPYLIPSLIASGLLLSFVLGWAAQRAFRAWNAECARRVAAGDLRLDSCRGGRVLKGLLAAALVCGTGMILMLAWGGEDDFVLAAALAAAYVSLSLAFTDLNNASRANAATASDLFKGRPSGYSVALDNSGIKGGIDDAPIGWFWRALQQDVPSLFQAVPLPSPVAFLGDERPMRWVDGDIRAVIAARWADAIARDADGLPDAASGPAQIRRRIIKAGSYQEQTALRWADLCEHCDGLPGADSSELKSFLMNGRLDKKQVATAARSLHDLATQAAEERPALWPHAESVLDFLMDIHSLSPRNVVLSRAKELRAQPGR